MKYSLRLASGNLIYPRKQQLVGSHTSWQAHKTRVQRGKLETNGNGGERGRKSERDRGEGWRESEIERTCVRSDNIRTYIWGRQSRWNGARRRTCGYAWTFSDNPQTLWDITRMRRSEREQAQHKFWRGNKF